MNVERRTVNFFDGRGTISDLLTATPVENVTLITSKAGSVRGNHYHLKATVYVYVLSGYFQTHSKMNGAREILLTGPGDLITFPPGDLHALVAIEDGSFLLMAHGKRGGDLTVQETLYTGDVQ